MINKYIALSAVVICSLIPSSSVKAATFGSALFTSQRSCSQVSAIELCDGRGLGQGTIRSLFGGGSGVNGSLNVNFGGGSIIRGSVGKFFPTNFPGISINNNSAINERIGITALGFQTFTYKGTSPARFSLTGEFSAFNSSTNSLSGDLPSGGGFDQFFNIVQPDFFDTDGSVFDLFNDLRSGFCGSAGVLGDGFAQGSFTGGAQLVTTSLSACAPTSLTLSPGQQFILIAGLLTVTNRGGFVEDASFGVRLGDDLTADERLNFANNLVPGLISAVPEPQSWAMMLVGFGLIGSGLRSRAAIRKHQSVLA
jgi:PEP-CTERM motif